MKLVLKVRNVNEYTSLNQRIIRYTIVSLIRFHRN